MFNPIDNGGAQQIPEYPLNEPRRGGEEPKGQITTTQIVVETFQLFLKALGAKRLENLFSQCLSGAVWAYHQESFASGNLQKTLKKDISEIINCPYEFSRFFTACRDMADLISIPLGISLQNERFSECLIPILTCEHKNLLDKSFNLKIPEKNAHLQWVLQKQLQPGASLNDKYKLMAEKMFASFEMASIISTKYNFQELSIGLTLASSLTKAYILYLEKTNTPPNELLKVLKMEAKLTLKMHLNSLPLAFEESEFASNVTIEEKDEILDEIHHEINMHLNLISTADNDGIYHNLQNYKNSMNELFSAYQIDYLENFNDEMDKLLLSCNPLIAYRKSMEQEGTKLLQDHGLFLDEQLEKLYNVFDEYQEKMKTKDFDRFIKPEFETAISLLEEQKQDNNTYLEELKINAQFNVIPFTVLSIEEQKTWFDAIIKATNDEKKHEISTLVKNVCREV